MSMTKFLSHTLSLFRPLRNYDLLLPLHARFGNSDSHLHPPLRIKVTRKKRQQQQQPKGAVTVMAMAAMEQRQQAKRTIKNNSNQKLHWKNCKHHLASAKNHWLQLKKR